MTRVFFVRHAQPNYANHNDLLRELSPKGLEDRKRVTHFLEDKQIQLVLSSPYKRAVDTVKDFADRFGFEIQTVEDFRERKVGGDWIEDFNTFAERQWRDFSYKLPDGESLGEVQRRSIAALNQVLEQHSGKIWSSEVTAPLSAPSSTSTILPSDMLHLKRSGMSCPGLWNFSLTGSGALQSRRISCEGRQGLFFFAPAGR